MELSELKVIWDSQNDEPLYAMNRAGLHAIIQRKNRARDRCLFRCFLAEITIGLVCGALMFVCAGTLVFGDADWLATLPWVRIAPTSWDTVAFLAAGVIWFYYSGYMFAAQRRQQRRVEVFDSSLRGDLERALSQTEFQIALAKSIVWWGLIPVWVASILWVATLLHLKAASFGIWVVMGIAIGGSLVAFVRSKQKSIANRFQPRLHELDSLRAKLIDPQR